MAVHQASTRHGDGPTQAASSAGDGRGKLTAVQAVTLDAGGVLLLPSREPVVAVLARFGLRPPHTVIDEAHYRAVAVVDAAAQPDWTTYLRGYLRACGVPEARMDTAIDALDNALPPTAWRQCPSGARTALRRLALRYPRLAVVSNSTGVIENLLVCEDISMCQVGPGPGTAMTAILDSGLVGVDKPDPAIFHAALTALDVPPNHALHVGDTVHADVLGAVGAGMLAAHVDPLGLCRDCPADIHVTGIAELNRILP